MKKSIAILLFVCLSLAVCVPGIAKTESKKLTIVSTIFPPYDFVRAIAGDNVELTMLLPPGSESHSFEPSPQDIIKIQNCDVFLYIGGETDAWVDRILDSMDTTNMTILPLLSMVDAVEEEIVEGMEHGHDHDGGDFDPSDVKDRDLADFDGGWQSIAPMVADGSLDAYIDSVAQENGLTTDAAKTAQLSVYQSDFDTFTVAGDTVSIQNATGSYSAAYAYEGYAIVESDHGASVWYQYAVTEPVEGMPAYLLFNDHGIGADEHDHEEEHEDALAHTHLRYGDEGFDALLEVEGWSPFFVAADATAEETLALLTGGSHSHGHDEEEEEAELDEHVWTSPQNAIKIVNVLAETLSGLDPANAAVYSANAAAYTGKLAELDQAFEEVIAGAARTTVVFGDRFPFRYLADAYGLTYYAAFPGCATETEASAATIKFLIDTARAEAVPVVFQIEFSNGKIADVICESTGARKLTLHSCHNLSKKDFESGIGYLELMYQNVESLKEALY